MLTMNQTLENSNIMFTKSEDLQLCLCDEQAIHKDFCEAWRVGGMWLDIEKNVCMLLEGFS